jgi:hypothetical protein
MPARRAATGYRPQSLWQLFLCQKVDRAQKWCLFELVNRGPQSASRTS